MLLCCRVGAVLCYQRGFGVGNVPFLRRFGRSKCIKVESDKPITSTFLRKFPYCCIISLRNRRKTGTLPKTVVGGPAMEPATGRPWGNHVSAAPRFRSRFARGPGCATFPFPLRARTRPRHVPVSRSRSRSRASCAPFPISRPVMLPSTGGSDSACVRGIRLHPTSVPEPPPAFRSRPRLAPASRLHSCIPANAVLRSRAPAPLMR